MHAACIYALFCSLTTEMRSTSLTSRNFQSIVSIPIRVLHGLIGEFWAKEERGRLVVADQHVSMYLTRIKSILAR